MKNLLNMDGTISLSEAQTAALECTGRNVLLYGVPGGGKTTVLVARAIYLMSESGAAPDRILNLAVNKSTVKAMENIYEKTAGEGMEPNSLRFTTIYSYCYHFLRKLDKKKLILLPKLIEDGKQLRTMFCDEAFGKSEDIRFETLVRDIAYVKNNMLRNEDIDTADWDIEAFPEIYRQYRNHCSSNYFMDHDDILCIALDAFSKYRDEFKKEIRLFDYINIDEAHCFTPLQTEIIKCLSKNTGMLVAGEGGMEKFKSFVAQPKEITLLENYRSTANIVASAVRFSKEYSGGLNILMKSVRDPAKSIKIKAVHDRHNQWNYVGASLEKEENRTDAAVMYRHDYSLIGLVDALDRYEIPFKIAEKRLRRFKHHTVEDIICFVSFILDKSDKKSFEHLFNKVNFGISKQIMKYIVSAKSDDVDIFELASGMPGIKPLTRRKVKQVRDALSYVDKLSPYHVIESMQKEFEYNKYLERNIPADERTDVAQMMDSIKKIARNSKDPVEFINIMEHITELIHNGGTGEDANAVSVVSMEHCGGLEFEKVILVDLIDDYFPSPGEDVKKEAGIFYNAVTRAKDMLEFIFPVEIDDNPVIPTRFVGQFIGKPGLGLSIKTEKDTDDSARSAVAFSTYAVKRNETPAPLAEPENGLRKFSVGEKVTHVKFGSGTVNKISGDSVVIGFNDGEKTLSLRFCSNPEIIK